MKMKMKYNLECCESKVLIVATHVAKYFSLYFMRTIKDLEGKIKRRRLRISNEVNI